MPGGGLAQEGCPHASDSDVFHRTRRRLATAVQLDGKVDAMELPPFPEDAIRQPLTRYDAAERHLSRDEVDGPLWPTSFRGVHHWLGVDTAEPRVRIEALAKVLPDGAAIGGWAAAYLFGATDVDGIVGDRHRLMPIPICLQPGVQVRVRPGTVVWRSEFGPNELVSRSGIPVLSPVRTCFDVIRRAPNLTEAVVGIDSMLRYGLVDRVDVEMYLADRPRWRGSPQARRALEFADAGVRSCAESRLRVLWVVDAGLPPPVVNVPVFDRLGNLLGLPDLFDADAGLAGEYDGSDHRTIGRHTADNVREELFETHGIIVVRATALDLSAYRSRTVARLGAAHTRGLRRNRALDGWTLGTHRVA